MNYSPYQVFYLAHPFAGDVPAIFDNEGRLWFGFKEVFENLKLGKVELVAKSLNPDGIMKLSVELPVFTGCQSDTVTQSIIMEFIDIANLHRCIRANDDIATQNYNCYVRSNS